MTQESVRSICYLDDEILLIGSISGAVFAYGLPMMPHEAIKLFDVEGGVTTIRAHNNGVHFMLCTTQGYIYCFHKLDDGVFEQCFKSMLHLPSESSEKFGSLRTISSPRSTC